MRTVPKAVFSDQTRCLCVDEKAKMHRKSDVFINTNVAAEKAQVYCNHSPITADITARGEHVCVHITFPSPPKTTATIANSLGKHGRKQYVAFTVASTNRRA